MPATDKASNITAPTQFLTVKDQKYAYRRFGSGKATPLLFLQHFTGTLDNWDPAVTDRLAQRGEVILFESAGLGRSSGKVPDTVAGMAKHVLAFLDALGLDRCDVEGFRLAAWSRSRWCWIGRLLPALAPHELFGSECCARRKFEPESLPPRITIRNLFNSDQQTHNWRALRC